MPSTAADGACAHRAREQGRSAEDLTALVVALVLAAIVAPGCGLDTSGARPVAPLTDAAGDDAGSRSDACVDCDGGPPAPAACAAASDCATRYCASGTCALARTCIELLDATPALPSGTYNVRGAAGAPLTVYCDMEHDGGGWLLAAKAHRHHEGFAPYVEPHDWLSTASDVTSLLDETAYENRLPGVASLGSKALAGVAAASTLSRFTLVAENESTQRLSWFKATTPDLFTWFTATTAQTASTVCSNVAMTESCSEGRIAYVKGACLDATCLEGMSLAAFGFPISPAQTLQMRLLGDADDDVSGVCSNTFNDDGWADSYLEHWGNGLMLWLR